MTYSRPGVYINETLLPAPVASVSGANAVGAAIGAFAKGPDRLTLVTSWYDFVQQFGGLNNAYPATFGINQFFVNGGGELFVRRVLGSGASQASASVHSTTSGSPLGTVKALDKGAAGNNLRIQVSKAGRVSGYYNITVYQEVVASELGTSNANATNDLIVEVFNNVRFDDSTSSDYAVSVVNASSKYITLTLSEGTPAEQTTSSVVPLTGGSDGSAPTATDYAGVVSTDGSSVFDTVDSPLVIFAPEIIKVLGATDAAEVHDALIAWADSGSGFAIIDTDENLSVGDAIDYITARTPSSHAAGYYPHYYIQDATARSRQALRKIGPAGAIAGLYLQNDRVAGPYKTPAGTGTVIRSAISLERAFSPADLDSLNTGVYTSGTDTIYGTAVNAIRNVPGAGTVVMGGRTLLQDGTSNRYINVRRSLIYIEKKLSLITQFAVFRNNDYKLWGQLANVISVFLNEYRTQGGLRGTSPSQAYFVKIDSTNNTAASIATGVVNIQVGVALEYPAEFVVINLSQITGN
jgi:hypothetical protein